LISDCVCDKDRAAMPNVEMKVPLVDATKYIDVGGIDNLANLQILSEETILGAVRGRYENDNIHTYVGDILIILNPYVRFPVYTDEVCT